MKIVLTQPNYGWLGKRAWEIPPYTLGILNSSLGVKAQLFDPNFSNSSVEDVYQYFKEQQPDIVGVSSSSTEYTGACRMMTQVIKQASPNSEIVQGGVIPTVMIESAMKDTNVDYWIMGEGEYRFPDLVLAGDVPDGFATYNDGIPVILPCREFIDNLDSLPFPDYGNLDIIDYGTKKPKFSQGLLPRNLPYSVTITSRGCPYQCVFCAASTVSGKKIRYRSAENVLAEIDILYKKGIREIVFLDDHFLGNKKRAMDILQGLMERRYDLLWKCSNIAVFATDEILLKAMKDSGCYQMTVSVESGNQSVLRNVIKKPVDLNKVPVVLDKAKEMGFEIIVNFVIGFPDETWEQIRETVRYAENLNVDLVNFHIATPLPKTELMKICLERGYLSSDQCSTQGFTKGVISTPEFTSTDLEIIRAFEWDRINFANPKRQETIARMMGITMDELNKRRRDTRFEFGKCS